MKMIRTLIVLLLLISCAPDESTYYFNSECVEILLENSEKGYRDIIIETNYEKLDINVSHDNSEEWLSASAMMSCITIAYEENLTDSPRTGVVTVSAGGYSSVYTIVQPNNPQTPPSDIPHPGDQEPGVPGLTTGMKVIGYLPSYKSTFKVKEWDKLDVINLSFARVNTDGSLDDAAVRKEFADFTSLAHDNDVKVVVSLGGAQRTADFSAALLSDAAINKTIEDCVVLVKDLGLDGIDVDYEGWNWGADKGNIPLQAGLLKLIKGLREALGNDAIVSAALMGNSLLNGWYTMDMVNEMNFVTLMAYDRTGSWSSTIGPHAPFEYYEELADACIELGMPKEKIIMGLPFYGNRFDGGTPKGAVTLSYKQIVDMYPGAEGKDAIEDIYLWYDGMPMIRRKCEYIMSNSLGGAMIWEISQDTPDASKSLLYLIDSILKK